MIWRGWEDGSTIFRVTDRMKIDCYDDMLALMEEDQLVTRELVWVHAERGRLPHGFINVEELAYDWIDEDDVFKRETYETAEALSILMRRDVGEVMLPGKDGVTFNKFHAWAKAQKS